MTIIDRTAASAVVLRPQPVGVFDGPAGLLLVGGDDTAPLLAALAAGEVPAEWPAGAAALAAAVAGDIDAALAALGEAPVDVVNRFVLAPSRESHRAAVAAAGDDPVLTTVVATAAFACGRASDPPSADDLDGELATLALTAMASSALEERDTITTLAMLRKAVVHAADVGPVLHARALGALAEHQHQLLGPSDEVIAWYDDAIALLRGSGHHEVCAGMQLQCGAVTHQLAEGQRHRLVDAIRYYQSALMVFTEDRHADAFAFANMNVALAILALPMTQASDQVRLGVAVQSLRAALRIYRPESHPDEWGSAQLNLANALQYLPSRHREENLAEAVELLEELLAHRSPQRDAAGYARALANQANALAHLGIFDHATAKYTEASGLFEAMGDTDAVAVVAAQLAQIAEHEAGAR